MNSYSYVCKTIPEASCSPAAVGSKCACVALSPCEEERGRGDTETLTDVQRVLHLLAARTANADRKPRDHDRAAGSTLKSRHFNGCQVLGPFSSPGSDAAGDAARALHVGRVPGRCTSII